VLVDSWCLVEEYNQVHLLFLWFNRTIALSGKMAVEAEEFLREKITGVSDTIRVY